MMREVAAGMLIAAALSGCGKHETAPVTTPAGREKAATTKALETGAAALQHHAPTGELTIYLSGLHVMKSDARHQMIAHHFCRQVNEDLAQCAIFDGNDRSANLIGVEYIISEHLFEQLPKTERPYWHPHNYEILSGQLIGPWLPAAAEKELMKGKMNSYGKTWHVWNTGMFGGGSRDSVPLGPPELAWSFNRDAEVAPGLLEKRDELQQVDARTKRAERADLMPLAHPQEGVEAMKRNFPAAGAYMPGVQEKK